ncbi:MAG: DUF4259 domain-containing protein [Actinobacteria bacterium]|nr:DUF4259 domain-containing protein [Actinomycetota bacterium]
MDLAGFAAELTLERIEWIREQVARTIADADTSELYELWAETEDLDAWLAEARALVAALA